MDYEDYDEDDYDDYGGAEEAIEVPVRGEYEPDDVGGVVDTYGKLVGDIAEEKENDAKPKRKITNRKPKATLTSADLVGPKGLIALREEFKNFKPDPKDKNPYGNAEKMLKKIEVWAHRLAPSYQFDDFLARAYDLGKTRPVKTYMMKMKSGQTTQEELDVVYEEREKTEKSKKKKEKEYVPIHFH